MNDKDGGPAFPVVTDQYDYGYEKTMPKQLAPGMTLRDYFAAKAMQGIAPVFGDLTSVDYCRGAAAKVSKIAYVMADAMLKAREAA